MVLGTIFLISLIVLLIVLTGNKEGKPVKMISAEQARALGEKPNQKVTLFLAALSEKVTETAPEKRSLLLTWGDLTEDEQAQARSILETDLKYKVEFHPMQPSDDPREHDYWTLEW